MCCTIVFTSADTADSAFVSTFAFTPPPTPAYPAMPNEVRSAFTEPLTYSRRRLFHLASRTVDLMQLFPRLICGFEYPLRHRTGLAYSECAIRHRLQA